MCFTKNCIFNISPLSSAPVTYGFFKKLFCLYWTASNYQMKSARFFIRFFLFLIPIEQKMYPVKEREKKDKKQPFWKIAYFYASKDAAHFLAPLPAVAQRLHFYFEILIIFHFFSPRNLVEARSLFQRWYFAKVRYFAALLKKKCQSCIGVIHVITSQLIAVQTNRRGAKSSPKKNVNAENEVPTLCKGRN